MLSCSHELVHVVFNSGKRRKNVSFITLRGLQLLFGPRLLCLLMKIVERRGLQTLLCYAACVIVFGSRRYHRYGSSSRKSKFPHSYATVSIESTSKSIIPPILAF